MPAPDQLAKIFKQAARKARDGMYADILLAIEDVANIPELMVDERPHWSLALELVVQLSRGTPQVEGAALKRKIRAAVSRRLGVTGDSLRSRLTEWLNATKAEFGEDLPAELLPLLGRVGDLGQVWHWPIEISKGARVDLIDGLPFDVEASAGARLTVESLDPAQLQPPLEVMPGNADRLLRLVLAGSYRVGAAADGLSGLFNISAGGNRDGGIQYRYLYAHQSESPLISALADSISSVPSPFSLSQIGVAGSRRLSELRFAANGKVGAEVSITASHAFVGALGKVDSGELPLSGAFSLSFSGSYRREGNFFLRAEPNDDGWVTISLGQTSASEASTRLGFDAGLTVRNIDRVLLPLMEKYLPGSEAISELLGDLGTPGTWIREEMTEKLKLSDGLAQRARDALLGDRRLVSSVVGDALESAVDLSGLDVSGRAEVEAKRVVDRLRTQLPLGPDLSSDIAAELSGAIASTVQKYSGAVDEAVKMRGRLTLDRLKSALEVLDAPEGAVDGFFNGADEKAAQLLEPVRKLVARYAALRGRLGEAISDNATASLNVELVRSWRSFGSKGAEMEVRLNSENPLARRIHRQIMFGDLTGLTRALRDKPARLDEAVEVKSGLLSETLAEETSLALNIGVLDRKLSLKSFARSGIKVIRDLGGRVMLVSGEIKVDKTATWRREEQRVGFVNELAMAARAAVPGRRLMNMARVNLSYSDENMKRKELDAYLDSVLDAGLMDPDEDQAIRASYEAISDQSDGNVKAVIELVMALPPSVFVKAARKETAEIRRVALGAIWDLIPRNSTTERMREFARSLGPSGSGPANLTQLPGIERASGNRIGAAIEKQFEKSSGQPLNSRSPLRHHVRRLAHMVMLAKRFADGLFGLKALTELDPGVEDFAKRARDLQSEIIDDLDPWMDAEVFALIFDKGVPRRNLAFIGALANLAGVEEPLIGNIRQV